MCHTVLLTLAPIQCIISLWHLFYNWTFVPLTPRVSIWWSSLSADSHIPLFRMVSSLGSAQPVVREVLHEKHSNERGERPPAERAGPPGKTSQAHWVEFLLIDVLTCSCLHTDLVRPNHYVVQQVGPRRDLLRSMVRCKGCDPLKRLNNVWLLLGRPEVVVHRFVGAGWQFLLSLPKSCVSFKG